MVWRSVFALIAPCVACAAQPDNLATARSLLSAGKLSEAETSTRAYLSGNASSADAHFLLGQILFGRQRARESLAEYTAGAKYRAPSAYDLKIVACDYVILGAYSDADKWFTASLERDANDPQTWYYLGRAKYNENRFDEAIAAFRKSLEHDPKNDKAEDNLGLSYEALGRLDEAIAAYRRSIGQQPAPPKDSEPFFNLGNLLVENGRNEEGLSWLQQAAQLSPDAAKIHRQLGKAYLHLDQLADAQRELEKAVQLEPNNPALHFMLGQTYRKAGKSELAAVEFAKCSKLNGEAGVPH